MVAERVAGSDAASASGGQKLRVLPHYIALSPRTNSRRPFQAGEGGV